jgi:uroporphyrinogen-III synthase
MKPLVILRPEPGASRTATRAAAMGLTVELKPLFVVAPLDWHAPDPAGFDGLILTSANAVRYGGEELQKLKDLPVHAVGEATAALARTAGFKVASVGDGGSGSMHLPEGRRLLHLTGHNRIDMKAAATIPIYDAREMEPPPTLAQLRDCVIAVHSPRAGRRLAELVGDRSSLSVAAISPAAAEACGTGWRRIESASEPNDAALLALAARLCESRDA